MIQLADSRPCGSCGFMRPLHSLRGLGGGRHMVCGYCLRITSKVLAMVGEEPSMTAVVATITRVALDDLTAPPPVQVRCVKCGAAAEAADEIPPYTCRECRRKEMDDAVNESIVHMEGF